MNLGGETKLGRNRLGNKVREMEERRGGEGRKAPKQESVRGKEGEGMGI